MRDYSHLKLDSDYSPTDRLHLIENYHDYLEFWMSLPSPQLTLVQKIKKFFIKIKGK